MRPSIAPEKLLRALLLEGKVAQAFFEAVPRQARERQLLSNEHFPVGGALIEAWAGLKSFRLKGRKGSGDSDDDPGIPTVNFRCEKRSNR